MVLIRPERPEDFARIGQLVGAAFADEPVVVDLVDRLRGSPGYRPGLALVAEEAGDLVGHVMLTAIELEPADGGAPSEVLCLSPLAVRPDRQRQGIGRALVTAALAAAERAGSHPLVVLEGAPGLYSRFGFTPAEQEGLLRPSPATPPVAFQVRYLGAAAQAGSSAGRPRGQVRYPEPFWALGCAGLPDPPEPSPDGAAAGRPGTSWLFELAQYAGWFEALIAEADPGQPVPTCPGWAIRDLAEHLGTVHRIVREWISQGHRPRSVGGDGSAVQRYSTGWRELYGTLAAQPSDAPAATWCPSDTTIGFWRRRMVLELAIHVLDALIALRGDSVARQQWRVPEPLALEGVAEALQLWLCLRGGPPGGDGQVIRLAAGPESWTVGLHPRLAEVHRLPAPADAVVSGSAAEVFRWLWGRGGQVELDGAAAAIEPLQRAMAKATG